MKDSVCQLCLAALQTGKEGFSVEDRASEIANHVHR